MKNLKEHHGDLFKYEFDTWEAIISIPWAGKLLMTLSIPIHRLHSLIQPLFCNLFSEPTIHIPRHLIKSLLEIYKCKVQILHIRYILLWLSQVENKICGSKSSHRIKLNLPTTTMSTCCLINISIILSAIYRIWYVNFSPL